MIEYIIQLIQLHEYVIINVQQLGICRTIVIINVQQLTSFFAVQSDIEYPKTNGKRLAYIGRSHIWEQTLDFSFTFTEYEIGN